MLVQCKNNAQSFGYREFRAQMQLIAKAVIWWWYRQNEKPISVALSIRGVEVTEWHVA
jgi:hypothetical protein